MESIGYGERSQEIKEKITGDHRIYAGLRSTNRVDRNSRGEGCERLYLFSQKGGGKPDMEGGTISNAE